MNHNKLKRLEKIEATLIRPVPVGNIITIRVICGASDMNQAIIKARSSPGHDVVFLPRHGKAECSTCSGARKRESAATFVFEGPAATQAQLDQLEACGASSDASESTKRAIRFLSKMGYFNGAHDLRENETLLVNCGVAVFHLPNKNSPPE